MVVTYAGHARLWQGDSVLDSDQIELWQDDKKLQATGHVVAVFPQVSGPLDRICRARRTSTCQPRARPCGKSCAPTLTYWSDQGKAHLEGGVYADSDQGSLESRTLDLFLTPATRPGTSGARRASRGHRRLSRDRVDASWSGPWLRGRWSSGRVTAGPWPSRPNTPPRTENSCSPAANPPLLMLQADTTTGHSLTFFVANDTILIDSQEGSRTLTKHRVEK